MRESGEIPIMVWFRGLSKERVRMQGMELDAAACRAAWVSSKDERVSKAMKSAPASLRAWICSSKHAMASESERGPLGSMSDPVGPTEAATSTGWEA